VSGALTAPYVARIATRQPTPGVGIIERINVYSMMLWLAVLAVALLRRRSTADESFP
jgi:MYXO-CTERM domain-containing protein